MKHLIRSALLLLAMTAAATAGQVPNPINAPATVTAGNVLATSSNPQQAADSGKALPSGAIVGTTDAQTLTAKILSGVDITGLDPTQGRGSVRIDGTIFPTTNAVASSIFDLQTVAPTGPATAIVGEQLLVTADGCASCDSSNLFGFALWSGHLIIAPTYAGTIPIQNIWVNNPARVTNSAHIPIANIVYYAAPGGLWCAQDGQTSDGQCSGISFTGATDSPGAGATFTYTTADFGIPTGSGTAVGSHMLSRALQLSGECGAITDQCYLILGTSSAKSQFKGNLQSNDANGWGLISNVPCSSTQAVIDPDKNGSASGVGCHTGFATTTWAMIAAGVESLWGNTAGVTIDTKLTFPDTSFWDNNGAVVGGTFQSFGGTHPEFEIVGAGGTAMEGIGRWSADQGSPILRFLKSRGAAVGTNTLVLGGDVLATIGAYGADAVATGGVLSSQVTMVATGTPAAGIVAGGINIKVADTTGALQSYFAIDNTGGACVATALNASTSVCAAANKFIDQSKNGTFNAVVAGSPTGGNEGAGTINAVTLYQNGTALGTAATQNTGTSGATVPLLNGTNTWAAAQTFTSAPVFSNQSGSRTALGLGTAATQNTGTSGANVPLMNGANTWAAAQTYSVPDVLPAGAAASGATFGPAGTVDELSTPGGVGTGAGTGAQILHSYTLPANSLDVVGRSIDIQACYQHAANTDTVTSTLQFGSIVKSDGGITVSGQGGCLTMHVVKTAANRQTSIGGGNKGATLFAPVVTDGSETDTAGIVIQFKSTDAISAANDNVLWTMTTKFSN